jgi:membrane-associated phospholipid phosphatase
MISWTHITHFGDITIMTIAALAIAGWLMAENEKRLALCWILLFTIGMSIVAASKIAFIGWGIGIASLDFTGFSGHAMRVAAVIPVVAYLLLQRFRSLPVKMAGVLLAYAVAALLGFSRIVVHAHSVSEVIAGLVLGGMVSTGFIWIASSLQRHLFNPIRAALVLVVFLPAPYVQPAPTQTWLTDVTLFISGHDQPYQRTGRGIAPGKMPASRLEL